MAITPGFALEYCASKQAFSPERYESLGVEILGMQCPEPHDVAPNGEVEGPRAAVSRAHVDRSPQVPARAAGRAPRAHTVPRRPRSLAARASRTVPTIVRGRPHRSYCARANPAAQTKAAKICCRTRPADLSARAPRRPQPKGSFRFFAPVRLFCRFLISLLSKQ